MFSDFWSKGIPVFTSQGFTGLIQALSVLGTLMSVLTIVQWLSPTSGKGPINPTKAEHYNESFAVVRSIRSMASVHRIICPTALQSAADTARYIGCLDSLLQLNFVHGYSHYSFGDNYVAHLLGRGVWSDIGAIVIPDDIMKQSSGSCSQQSIAFLEVLHRQGFRVRGVKLKFHTSGHFAAAVFYGNAWRYYDVDLEARVNSSMAPDVSAGQLDEASVRQLYPHILANGDRPDFVQGFTRLELMPEGSYRGMRMELLHHITWFVSWFGGPLLLLMAIGLRTLRHVARMRTRVAELEAYIGTDRSQAQQA